MTVEGLQAEDMLRRLERVEKRNRRLLGMCCLLLLVVVALACHLWLPLGRSTVEATRFTVIDEQGQKRAAFGLFNGSPGLVVRDARGRSRIQLGVKPHLGMELPQLVFYDLDAKPNVVLLSSPREGFSVGHLSLLGEQKRSASVGFSGGWPSIDLSGPTGNGSSLSLDLTFDSPHVTLFDQAHNRRFSLVLCRTAQRGLESWMTGSKQYGLLRRVGPVQPAPASPWLPSRST